MRRRFPFAPGTVTGPFGAGGVDWAFECTGNPGVLRAALDVLDWGGTAVAIGVPPPGVEVGVPVNHVIHLDRKQGPKEKVEELASRLKAMLEESEPPLPEDVILSELGTTYEQLGRKEDAMQSYKRIMDEFPQSGYRTTAQERLGALDPSHPVAPRQGAFPMVQGSGS